MSVSTGLGPNESPNIPTPRRSAPRTYTMTYDSANLERANDQRLDLWLRLSYLAQWRMNQIGHAEFAQGEIRKLLGIKVKQRLTEALRTAKKYGFLTSESSSYCLVVPGHVAVRKEVTSTRCRHHGVDKWGGNAPVVTEERSDRYPKPELRLVTSDDADVA